MSTKDYSIKQESSIASSLGWKVVSGSGSRSFHPGDVKSDKWLGECKTHIKPGHKIRFDIHEWGKIEDEAQSQRKNPVLFVDDGSQDLNKTWCFVSPSFLQDIELDECVVLKPIIVNTWTQGELTKLLDKSEYVFIVILYLDKKLAILKFSDFKEYYKSLED